MNRPLSAILGKEEERLQMRKDIQMSRIVVEDIYHEQ